MATASATTWKLVTRSEPLASERTTQPEPRPASVEMVNTDGSVRAASCDQSVCSASRRVSTLISDCMRAMVLSCAAAARASYSCARHARPAEAATPATSTAATTPAAPGRRLRTFDLLQLGPEGRLSLGHAEHRVVELVESVVDLLDVVVVHAADQLLHRGDAGAEAVAQLAVRSGQRSRDLGRLAVRLERLHVLERLLRRRAASAVAVARDDLAVVSADPACVDGVCAHVVGDGLLVCGVGLQVRELELGAVQGRLGGGQVLPGRVQLAGGRVEEIAQPA